MSAVSDTSPNYGLILRRYLSSSQWDRALETAREWLQSDSENLQAHRAAAQALIQLKRYDEAKAHLEKVLAANPLDGFAHRLMSISAFNTGDLKKADEAIHTAMEISPRDAYHWYHLAWMSYRQGDMETAHATALKARELEPNDADILSLVALTDSNRDKSERLKWHYEALSLDPENANTHNNIGSHHLNVTNDPKAAEESFRRALSLNPASKTYRSNLFLAIKRRDPVYRSLRLPLDSLLTVWRFFALRKGRILLPLLLIPVWMLCARFVIGGVLLWFMLVWPLVKFYEYLTVGDILAKAGDIGACGGFLAHRRWPLKVRLGIFALVLAAFWGGVVLLCRTEVGMQILPVGFGVGVMILLGAMVIRGLKRRRRVQHSRERASKLKPLLDAENE